MSAQDDLLRQDALQDYGVLSAASDPALTEITALAAQICGTPVAALSLFTADFVCFQSRVGPGPDRLPRGRMPCEICVRGNQVYEINDARYHKDFQPDGIMVGGRSFRFYAGAPLTTPAGVNIGCLFVQDSVPHTLTEMQRSALCTLSRQVVLRLELHSHMRRMERDEVARRRIESELTIERNFVSTVLDTVDALVAVFDPDGRIVRFNRACEQASGYDFSTLQRRYVWEKLIPIQDIPAAIVNFQQLRKGPFPTQFENHWLRKDGALRRIAWSATALLDARGRPSFIIATGLDITSQREAETTLVESEGRYRQLVEGSLGLVCTHDLSGRLISLNSHGAENFGRSVEEMTGALLTSFMPEEYHAEFAEYLREIERTGEAQGRLLLLHRDGSLHVIAFRNKLITQSGREPHVLGFGIDISKQVRAEDKLQRLTSQSNSILESVGDGIYGIDLGGRVTIINPAAAQMLGYKPEELIGRELHPLVHHTRADGAPYPAEECPITGTLSHHGSVRVSNEVFWRKDGSSFPVEYVARPQIGSTDGTMGKKNAGKAIGVVVAFTDTTERRALDRMKDEFISTVSHELRTPLTSLRGALGLLSGGALEARPEKMRQMLEVAVGNTDRLIHLVNDILDIERISSGSSELLPLSCRAGELLRRAAGMQRAAALKLKVTFSLADDGASIWVDPDRMLQALSNLISNAIKFSPPGGKILLTVRRLDDHETQIDIQDEGEGIPYDKLEHIFERFQQGDASDTRAMGGTGLGLAICRSIVAQHGGRIWATSPKGQGAKFHIILPRNAVTRLR